MIFSLAGCGGHGFPAVGSVTSATMSISASDGSKYLWTISDPEKLTQIVAFVDGRRTGWSKLWYGTPVPIVEVRLFDGDIHKGVFGVGKNFFETQREGSFFSKRASSSDVRDFLKMLDVDDATFKEFAK